LDAEYVDRLKPGRSVKPPEFLKTMIESDLHPPEIITMFISTGVQIWASMKFHVMSGDIKLSLSIYTKRTIDAAVALKTCKYG
jgi:hypothetical protein